MKILIEDLIQRANKVSGEIMELTRDMDEERLTERVSEKSWSVSEVLSHLNMTFEHYFPKIKEALSKASGDAPEFYTQSFMMSLFSNGLKPKKGRRRYKMKTFSFLEPHQNTFEENFLTFKNMQEEFISLMKEGREKSISKIKINSALGPIFKMSLAECFEFLISHEERHLLQIKEILQEGALLSSS